MATQTSAKENKGQKATGFIKGVRSEFKKIAWPTRKQLVQYTIVVIIMSILLSILVFGLDFIFLNLIELIIR
ncbi:MAG: preprotein translocase subunit SecE [Tissierellia bacterium]|jgi:preprotein translocase subunit SecE|nr:preprotein translocase subunit SecE [Bacillota bacterium]NLK59219.1 preprotein translocase subunit SecE [Tissierellia bacterium]